MIKEQWLFLQDVAKLIIFAAFKGFTLTAGEMYRPPEMQKIYFDQGKSKTMLSLHGKRLAIDFNFFVDGVLTYDFEKIKIMGDYWESLSPLNRWGGDFNKNDIKDGFVDTPHFERNI
jgi:hypothetical protein